MTLEFSDSAWSVVLYVGSCRFLVVIGALDQNSKHVTMETFLNVIARRMKAVKRSRAGWTRFRLVTFAYRLLPYFGLAYPRLVEWSFVRRNLPNPKCKLLDVGSTGSLFVYELERKRFDTYAIDARSFEEQLPPSIKFIEGDITATRFPNGFFDFISCISTIEHIGLGAYGDPAHGDGDLKAMAEMKRIMKPGGKLCLTTVAGKDWVLKPTTHERVYDEQSFGRLLDGFIVEKEEFYVYSNRRWVRATKSRAFAQDVFHYAIACALLLKE